MRQLANRPAPRERLDINDLAKYAEKHSCGVLADGKPLTHSPQSRRNMENPLQRELLAVLPPSGSHPERTLDVARQRQLAEQPGRIKVVLTRFIDYPNELVCFRVRIINERIQLSDFE